MRFRNICKVALLALWPGQAFALSCLPWGVTDAFLQADAAEEGYVVVLGQLDFDAGALPEVNLDRQDETPPLTRIPAQFEGAALVRGAANVPFAVPVVLEVACFGPWCPQPRPGEVLAFLRKDGEAFVLDDNPCGGFLFTAEEGLVAQARQCLAGGECAPLAERQ